MAGVSCSLCRKIIEDLDECKVCSDGHKFHKKCINDYWKTQVNGTRPILMCPVTNTEPSGDWKNCTDLHSGGKRRKRRYSKKNKKNHKKYFSKSKKRK